MVRDYLSGIVTALGGSVLSGAATYSVAVPGITPPVPVFVEGPPQEDDVDFQPLAISISILDFARDMKRLLPTYRSVVVNNDNTCSVGAFPPQPYNFMIEIEIQAPDKAKYVALMEFILAKLPGVGFGSTITVCGSAIPFSLGIYKNMTQETMKHGRLFMGKYDYTFMGWFTSAEVVVVKQILHIHTALEIQPTGQVLDQTAPVATGPDLVATFDVDAS